MNEERIQIKQKLKDDLQHYSSRCLKIRTKSGTIQPLIFNKAQLFAHSKLEEQKGRTGKVRALVLKARQQGMSTMIAARYYHKVSWNTGMQAFILTHALDATNNLYAMAKRLHEYCPVEVRPEVGKSNAKELAFSLLDSGYKLGTAENKNVGRSSTIQLLHGSEVGFWNNAAEHATGIMQAVPNAPGTEIILESTANGVGNYFHQMWQDAEAGISDFIAIFVPWYWQDEYYSMPDDIVSFVNTPLEEELQDIYNLSVGQLNWRRKKIVELSVNGVDGEKSFRQEYPSNAAEAFILTGEDSYIDSSLVAAARSNHAERYGPLVVGVDPARFGDDRTSIILRQGRCSFGLKSYVKKDTMEVAGIVHMLIEELKPSKVFVDVGGLGAGVVDRLHELNHDCVVGVNAGSSPLDANKYKNKRAEMWGEMKAWLSDGTVQIPNSDSLHADLCNIKYKFDSNSRLQMESKDEMKKRGVRSPDESDALALTFALPAAALNANAGHNDMLSSLVNSFTEKQTIINRSRR